MLKPNNRECMRFINMVTREMVSRSAVFVLFNYICELVEESSMISL